jgi:hypothetical protein
LFAALRVDHSEAMDTKRDSGLPMAPDLIRPSMDEPTEHTLQQLRLTLPAMSTDTAHRLILSD